MGEIRFLWDDSKEAVNRRKHGVSFEETKSVFYDERARRIYDPDHSIDEDRYVMLGMSYRFRVLVVSHTYRQDDQEIRLISARKANRNEQAQYTQFGNRI